MRRTGVASSLSLRFTVHDSYHFCVGCTVWLNFELLLQYSSLSKARCLLLRITFSCLQFLLQGTSFTAGCLLLQHAVLPLLVASSSFSFSFWTLAPPPATFSSSYSWVWGLGQGLDRAQEVGVGVDTTPMVGLTSSYIITNLYHLGYQYLYPYIYGYTYYYTSFNVLWPSLYHVHS